jgi:hypothetical protein
MSIQGFSKASAPAKAASSRSAGMNGSGLFAKNPKSKSNCHERWVGKKQSLDAVNLIESVPDDAEKALLAAGRYSGEGFDDERLDTFKKIRK